MAEYDAMRRVNELADMLVIGIGQREGIARELEEAFTAGRTSGLEEAAWKIEEKRNGSPVCQPLMLYAQSAAYNNAITILRALAQEGGK